MTESQFLAATWTLLFWLLQLVFMARALLRRHRDPASRFAWVVVMAALPVLGIAAYLLLGETNIGRRRVSIMHKVLARLPDMTAVADSGAETIQPDIPANYAHLFQVGHSVNGFQPV